MKTYLPPRSNMIPILLVNKSRMHLFMKLDHFISFELCSPLGSQNSPVLRQRCILTNPQTVYEKQWPDNRQNTMVGRERMPPSSLKVAKPDNQYSAILRQQPEHSQKNRKVDLEVLFCLFHIMFDLLYIAAKCVIELYQRKNKECELMRSRCCNEQCESTKDRYSLPWSGLT